MASECGCTGRRGSGTVVQYLGNNAGHENISLSTLHGLPTWVADSGPNSTLTHFPTPLPTATASAMAHRRPVLPVALSRI